MGGGGSEGGRQRVAPGPDPSLVRCRAYADELSHASMFQLENESVLDGTHVELVYRCKGLKRKREQMKLEAKYKLTSSRALVQQLLNYEVRQIDGGYKTCMERVKEKMNLELATRIKGV